MGYTKNDIASIPLTEFMAALGEKPVKAFEDMKLYYAPQRDDPEPMLVVDTNTNRWYDHATDQSGDIVDLAALKMNPKLYTDPRDFIVKYMNDYEHGKELSAMSRQPLEPNVVTPDIRKIKLTDFMKALGQEHPIAADGDIRIYNAPYDIDKSPSMIINTRTNTWRDMKTGAYGGIYDLAYEITGSANMRELNMYIAGEKLLNQELLNAVYTGPFVSDARRHFSKNGCPAYKLGADYLNGNAIEQAYLSTILKWAARHDGVAKIDEYMALHKFDPNANKLWAYFVAIITWIRSTFPKYRREMKGLDWGAMYDEFHENTYDTDALEKQIHDLMEDDEIMKKAGIYRYVLSGDLRDLSFRTFDKKQKREAYERQKGICVHCHKHFKLEEMEADHITPWKEGGTTVADNCQMLCRNCNRIKGAK